MNTALKEIITESTRIKAAESALAKNSWLIQEGLRKATGFVLCYRISSDGDIEDDTRARIVLQAIIQAEVALRQSLSSPTAGAIPGSLPFDMQEGYHTELLHDRSFIQSILDGSATAMEALDHFNCQVEELEEGEPFEAEGY